LFILSGDNLTKYIQKKPYFKFVINLITQTKEKYRKGRRFKFCATMHSLNYIVYILTLYLLKSKLNALINVMAVEKSVEK